jgi:alpha-1,4-digalacturonate transport system permease protein
MRGIAETLGGVAEQAYGAVMRLPEPLFRVLQARLGIARMGYVFVAPNLLLFAVFVVLPIALNIYYAVTGGTALFPGDRPFVGGQNVATLLDCASYLDPSSCAEDRFWRGIYNTSRFVVLQVGFMIAFSLVTALVLDRKIIGRSFFRSVFFYPVLLSPVVVAFAWRWMLQGEGLLNAAITGAGGSKILFLLDPGWAFFWTIFISIWAHMGFYTLILLAGLQSIPRDLYEAAELDGTPKFRAFHRITLPLLAPTLLVVVILALIRAVQIFDEVYVLTGGGPGTATQYIVQYIYDTAFSSHIHMFGLAAAASLLLGVVLLVLTVAQLALARRAK